MGLLDTNGFNTNDNNNAKNEKLLKEAIDSTIVSNIDPLLKYKVISKTYNLGKILESLGYRPYTGNIFCPFHPDAATGKPSAKYHIDSDSLYCFSENKTYTSYHALKYLYGMDMNQVFYQIWITLPNELKQKYVEELEEEQEAREARHRGDKSENDNNTFNVEISLQNGKLKQEVMTWNKYNSLVLHLFKENKITYRQYKNAVYKVFGIIHENNQAKEAERKNNLINLRVINTSNEKKG